MASPHTGGAHGFSQQALERKLQNLSSTVQNIQVMAQWAIHYRKHAKTITAVWYKELQKGEKPRLARLLAIVSISPILVAADSNRKLTLLYLANDIIQNGRKKGSEFKAEFTRILPRAFSK